MCSDVVGAVCLSDECGRPLMNILVDFDNWFPQRCKKSGNPIDVTISSLLIDTYNKLTDTIGGNIDEKGGVKRCKVRFYGGWYSGRFKTPKAQTLSSVLSNAQFVPYRKGNILYSAEIAYSIMASPRYDFTNTLRRGFPTTMAGFPYHSNHSFSCGQPACPLHTVKTILDNNGDCPHPGCNRNLIESLYHVRQKMVDIMIAMDLVHFASIGGKVALWSDDDDYWPAISHAISLNTCELFHIYNRVAIPHISVAKNYHKVEIFL